MSSIHFTAIEVQFFSPLVENRLRSYRDTHLTDQATQKRFEKEYVIPLTQAFSKLSSSEPEKYSAMEKALLAGCIREWMHGKERTQQDVVNDLLKKLDPPKIGGL